MNILLISDGSLPHLVTILQDLGKNVVQLRTTQQIMSNTYEKTFNVIVISTINNNTVFASSFITLVNTYKVPVLIAYVNYVGTGLGYSSNNALGMLGLSSSCKDASGISSSTITNNHKIFEDNLLFLGNSFAAYSPGTYMTAITESLLARDSIILCKYSAGNATGVLFPKGITTLNSTRLESEVIFLGFTYQNVTPVAQMIIRSALNYLHIKPYKVSGRVVDSNQNPIKRTMYVIEQSNFYPLDKVDTDEDGNYQFFLKDASPVTLICTPFNSNNNAQIRYNVIPELRNDLDN